MLSLRVFVKYLFEIIGLKSVGVHVTTSADPFFLYLRLNLIKQLFAEFINPLEHLKRVLYFEQCIHNNFGSLLFENIYKKLSNVEVMLVSVVMHKF